MAVRVANIAKALVLAYIITTVLLLITAYGLYKWNFSDGQTTAAIIVIYALSSFVGGFILAKVEKTKRLLWGIGFGILYFTILLVGSLIIGKGTAQDMTAMIRALIICIISGAVGAFVSPS